MYVEIIFETGNKSVAFYDTEEEAVSALEAHHARAKNGESGGPTGHPAERIKKALMYDEHPADLNASGLLPVEAVREAFDEAVEKHSMGGQVSNMEIAAAVRATSDSHVAAEDRHKHESQYKAEATGELTGSWSGDN